MSSAIFANFAPIMIKHIVMWKLLPQAEGKSAAQNAQWMKSNLESLMGVVPELLSCEVGINVKEGNYDACLIATFDSLAAPEPVEGRR